MSLLAGSAPSRAALDGVLAAWRTSRDSPSLARAAALAWCYLVDAPNAEHVLRMLANDNRDPAMAAWAVEFQRRLDAGLTLAAITDEMRKSPVDGALAGGGNEWTLDLVGAMRDVEARAGLEYARNLTNSQIQSQSQGPSSAMPMSKPPMGR